METKEKSKRSTSLDRRIQVYLTPSSYQKASRYVTRTGNTQSSLVAKAVEEYFKNHPEPIK